MQFNLNSFLIGLSTALDLAEEDLFGLDIHHSKRVAYISLRIAKVLRFSQQECFDLTALALLHDNGITESYQGKLISNELGKLEALDDHCVIGENNVKNFPFLTQVDNIILYHHEHFDGSGFFGKKYDEVPLMSQIISFADKLDFNFDLEDDSIENRVSIKKFVVENTFKYHSNEIAHAFLRLFEIRAFWLDLKSIAISDALKEHIPSLKISMSLTDIYQVTEVFSRIIDAKSKFTSRHSTGLIELAEIMADFYSFGEKKKIKFKIAASLHDIGKLAISNTILDKKNFLVHEEFDKVKTHTYYTHYILKSIKGFEDINHWASSHHEKLDGTGYPFGLNEEELSFEAKLMSCLDIYQALREDRPYRDGMPHNDIISIMLEMVEKRHIDSHIVQDIKKHLAS